MAPRIRPTAIVILVAEVTVPRKMFAAIPKRIQRLRTVESMVPL